MENKKITITQANQMFPAALKELYDFEVEARNDDDFWDKYPEGTFEQWLAFNADLGWYLSEDETMLQLNIPGGPSDAWDYYTKEKGWFNPFDDVSIFYDF